MFLLHAFCCVASPTLPPPFGFCFYGLPPVLDRVVVLWFIATIGIIVIIVMLCYIHIYIYIHCYVDVYIELSSLLFFRTIILILGYKPHKCFSPQNPIPWHTYIYHIHTAVIKRGWLENARSKGTKQRVAGKRTSSRAMAIFSGKPRSSGQRVHLILLLAISH